MAEPVEKVSNYLGNLVDRSWGLPWSEKIAALRRVTLTRRITEVILPGFSRTWLDSDKSLPLKAAAVPATIADLSILTLCAAPFFDTMTKISLKLNYNIAVQAGSDLIKAGANRFKNPQQIVLPLH